MSQQPFFTIGIPTHNRAAFLRQAIDSALRQTHADLELVVSDNASTDDTPAIVAGIKDPRLRFARQTENIGALRNMNFLIDQARGRFFVLHQDDDLLHPEFLARCRLALGERSDISLFATAVLSGAEPEGVLGEQLCFRDPPWQPLSWLSDQPAVIGGVDAAIMQLFSLPFIPPGSSPDSTGPATTSRWRGWHSAARCCMTDGSERSCGCMRTTSVASSPPEYGRPAAGKPIVSSSVTSTDRRPVGRSASGCVWAICRNESGGSFWQKHGKEIIQGC